MVEKKISELSVPELKAYAYDLIASREQVTNQLQQINQMIVQKLKEPVKVTKIDKPVPKKSK